jgi:hypothetical protein
MLHPGEQRGLVGSDHLDGLELRGWTMIRRDCPGSRFIQRFVLGMKISWSIEVSRIVVSTTVMTGGLCVDRTA